MQLEHGENWRERVAQLVAEHREELVLAAIRRARCLLGDSAIRDVDEQREALRVAIGSHDGRCPHRDIDHRAVAPRPQHLAATDLLAAREVGEVLEDLVTLFGVERRPTLSEHLGGRPAEHPLGGGIPDSDLAFQIGHHDRGGAGVNHRVEGAVGLGQRCGGGALLLE